MTSPSPLSRTLLLLALLSPAVAPGHLHGQAEAAPDTVKHQNGPDGWNGPRVMALVRRAIRARTAMGGDAGLDSYTADARGWLYFFVDRDGTDQRVLVKIDQFALKVYWLAPGVTKQVIIGRRGQNRLPNEMVYHMDHFTVVQNDFGSRIRLGGGEEVRDVPHPIAAGADSIYDYRLADSTSIYLAGEKQPVRVYDVLVRPRNPHSQAIVGSVYIDRQTAQIARMTFTFTPASYRDPRLDYIRISLDNALWQGRYWLPYRQELEIRRKIPVLDFPLGSVILGRYKVLDYHLHEHLPITDIAGPSIVMAPDSVRAHFPFKEGLYSDLVDSGLSPGPDLATVEREAHRMMRQVVLSGLPRVRLHVPGVSSLLRYDRAEGLFLGAGLVFTLHSGPRLSTDVGRAFADHRTYGAVELRTGGHDPSRAGLSLRAFYDDLRDLGQQPGTAGAVNTLAMAVLGRDYLDPYYASGASISARRPLGRGWSLLGGLRLEHDEDAHLAATASMLGSPAELRPVLPVTTGTLAEASLGVRARQLPTALGRLDLDLTADAGRAGGSDYLRPTLDVTLRHDLPGDRGQVRLDAHAGIGLGDPPRQRLFLLGGPGTLPGYTYRSFVGDRYARLGVEASHDVWRTWIALRAVAGAGWTGASSGRIPPGDPWSLAGLTTTGTVRPYAGLGLGFFAGIARLDCVRGLRDGEWQLVLSARHDLWGIL